MKGKVIRGTGFRGCLNYLLASHKGAEFIGGNMAGRSPKELAREFGHIRRIRPDCAKPVLHIPLRMPDGEDVTADKWNSIATRFLELMKISPARPWLLVKHPDQHVHLLTSRVDFWGALWLGKWEAFRCIEATQRIEHEFGLTQTPGLEGADNRQVRLTSGQLKKAARELERGKQPAVPIKVQLAKCIARAVATCNGAFDDFRVRLGQLGVGMKLNTATNTQHVSGISFEIGGIAMKGSQVARAYSWRGLSKLIQQRARPNVLAPSLPKSLTASTGLATSGAARPSPTPTRDSQKRDAPQLEDDDDQFDVGPSLA